MALKEVLHGVTVSSVGSESSNPSSKLGGTYKSFLSENPNQAQCIAWFQASSQDTGVGDQLSSCEELLADPGVVEVSPRWTDGSTCPAFSCEYKAVEYALFNYR